jgi:hypothetical protein
MAVMMPPLDERTPDPAYGEALTTCLATEMNRASRSLEKPFQSRASDRMGDRELESQSLGGLTLRHFNAFSAEACWQSPR